MRVTILARAGELAPTVHAEVLLRLASRLAPDRGSTAVAGARTARARRMENRWRRLLHDLASSGAVGPDDEIWAELAAHADAVIPRRFDDDLGPTLDALPPRLRAHAWRAYMLRSLAEGGRSATTQATLAAGRLPP